MEYVFGNITKKDVQHQVLKTIDNKHSDLSGKFINTKKYDDTVISDSCEIIEKYHSSEDIEGNCYDWYLIKNHNRTIDKIIRFVDVPKDIKNQIIDEYTLDLIEQGVL